MHCYRFLLVTLLLAGTGSVAASTIHLESAGDIRDIEQLDYEVDRLVAKVRQCAAAGLASVNECFCHYPRKLASARSAFQKLLVKHPDWEDRSIRWPDNRAASQLHLRGLREKIEQPCLSAGEEGV